MHRSRRGSRIKRLLLRLIALRPYRCWSCGWRYYGSIFSRHYQSKPALSFLPFRVPVPLLAATFGLVVLSTVPLLVFGSVPIVRVFRSLANTGVRADSSGRYRRPAAYSGSVSRSPARADAPLPSPALEPEYQTALDELQASAGSPILRASPQALQRETIGNLRSTGEVYVNNSKVLPESVVFSGDRLRTGADGSAAIEVKGKGIILVSSQTEILLAGSRGYFATLKQGAINLHSLASAQDFEVRTGQVVVAPDTTMDNTADIVANADGSVRVTCFLGSIGVIPLEGTKANFLQPGQQADVSRDGAVALTAPSPTPGSGLPPASSASQVAKGGSGHGALIALGVGGGAAAGIAAAVASKGGGSNSTSPSAP